MFSKNAFFIEKLINLVEVGSTNFTPFKHQLKFQEFQKVV